MNNYQGNQAFPRCECHECTQVRWKSSLQAQIQQTNIGPGSLLGGGNGQSSGGYDNCYTRVLGKEKAGTE